MSAADILRIAAVSDAQISPNGEWIATRFPAPKVIQLVQLFGWHASTGSGSQSTHTRPAPTTLKEISFRDGRKFVANQLNCFRQVGMLRPALVAGWFPDSFSRNPGTSNRNLGNRRQPLRS